LLAEEKRRNTKRDGSRNVSKFIMDNRAERSPGGKKSPKKNLYSVQGVSCDRTLYPRRGKRLFALGKKVGNIIRGFCEKGGKKLEFHPKDLSNYLREKRERFLAIERGRKRGERPSASLKEGSKKKKERQGSSHIQQRIFWGELHS